MRWSNVSLIHEIFNENEVASICNQAISRPNQQSHQLAWIGTSRVEFSVKSAYHLEKEINMQCKVGSSKATVCSSQWKRIWKINVLGVIVNI